MTKIDESRILPLDKVVETFSKTVESKVSTLESKIDKINEGLNVEKYKKKISKLEDNLSKLQQQVTSLEQDKANLAKEVEAWKVKYANINKLEDREKMLRYYYELLNFCFTNITPTPSFDPQEARFHFENLVK